MSTCITYSTCSTLLVADGRLARLLGRDTLQVGWGVVGFLFGEGLFLCSCLEEDRSKCKICLCLRAACRPCMLRSKP